MKKHSLIFLLLTSLIFSRGISQEVKIGDNIWMSQNLNTFYFKNGDPIPVVKSLEEWELASKNKTPACCFYNNVFENGKNHGLLYNYYALIDPRGLAPEGWHISTDSEWENLCNISGGKDSCTYKLKSKSDWGWSTGIVNCENCNNWSFEQQATNQCKICNDTRKVEGKISCNGIDVFGFNAKPSGKRDGNNFTAIGLTSFWWSLNEQGEAEYVNMIRNYENGIGRIYHYYADGYSVRCVKNK